MARKKVEEDEEDEKMKEGVWGFGSFVCDHGWLPRGKTTLLRPC